MLGERINQSNHHFFLLFILLAIAALTFFSRIFDPDFFWHLANGRWITANTQLPDQDPFTGYAFDSVREQAILKSYWLAQVGYSLFFAIGGFFAIALFKSLSFLAIFAMILSCQWQKKTRWEWLLLAFLPLYETLMHFRADRPNLVSFVGFACLLYLLEKRHWKLLPVLMLVWANSHGGYLLGIVTIVIYVTFSLVSRQQRLSAVTGWALLAIAVSFINPLGISLLLEFIKFQNSALQQQTFEFMSPLRLAAEYRDYYLGYFFALLLSLSAVLVVRRPAVWASLAVLALTIVISLQSARYMPFMVIAAAFYVPAFLDKIALPVFWRRALIGGSVLLMLFLFFFDARDGRGLTWGLEPERFPEKAAEFLARTAPGERIFCNYEWGGYLLWALPWATILNDTRSLSETIYVDNQSIEKAQSGWERKLEDLGATTLVISAFNPITGRANKLWQSLFYQESWALVYVDDVALVYQRASDAVAPVAKSSQDKRRLSLNHAVAQSLRIVEKYPQTPWHWADLGYIYVLKGEIPAAIDAYKKAASLDPENLSYQDKLKLLGSRAAGGG
ncbi:MAG: tetratricopeptide repeat protein [Desulfuromonadales bacterium]|nr:tetratricopeptide repeat protein [Desulfuromonadales bacterium]